MGVEVEIKLLLSAIVSIQDHKNVMKYLGVDRKGWVPVPHPGYHY